MTPAQAIAALDRQLAAHGETVTLQRLDAGEPVGSVNLRAFVRGFSPQELVNGISQDDARVVMSPTGLSGWDSGGEDAPVPNADNGIVVAGRVRRIVAAVGIRMADQVVRIECAVR